MLAVKQRALQRSNKQYHRLPTADVDADESPPASSERAEVQLNQSDGWFHGDLTDQSAGDPRGRDLPVEMSAITGWQARDIKSWRDELAEAAKNDTTRSEKAFTLLVAASAYVAGGAWSGWVKQFACPASGLATAGALCQDMKFREKLLFFVWAAMGTVVVTVIVWFLHFLRDKADSAVARNADDEGSLTAAEEKLIATKALKAVDLVSGGWIYSSAYLWSVALHSFLSYTTLSGAWEYFLLNLCFVLLFSLGAIFE